MGVVAFDNARTGSSSLACGSGCAGSDLANTARANPFKRLTPDRVSVLPTHGRGAVRHAKRRGACKLSTGSTREACNMNAQHQPPASAASAGPVPRGSTSRRSSSNPIARETPRTRPHSGKPPSSDSRQAEHRLRAPVVERGRASTSEVSARCPGGDADHPRRRAKPSSRSAIRSCTSSRPMCRRRHGPAAVHFVAVRARSGQVGMTRLS